MPLLRYDVSVNANGKEKSIHSTRSLPAAAYHDDISVHRVAWHRHDELELFHLLSGTIICLIGTHRFRLEAGEAMFINTQLLHGAWDDNSSPCRFHSIVFHPRLIGGSRNSVLWQKLFFRCS